MAQSNPFNQRQSRKLTAIGLMSGTSMDGIDVALITSDGEGLVECGPAMAMPYDSNTRRLLAEALETAKAIEERAERPGNLSTVEEFITMQHSKAISEFLDANKLEPRDIDVIGFHGQTVLHRPEKALTVQLGNGEMLAETCGISVVYDMRANDMASGGQGAPLVPVFHAALASNIDPVLVREKPVAFVNIGGISNITYVPMDSGDLVAFDCGPGNALLDQWVQAHAGIPFDQGGAIAAEGGILARLKDRYLSAAFFEKPAPKSLDRNDFLPPEPEEASLEDGARTLAHITAASIMKSCDHLPEVPGLWIICGGGRHHPAIMADLKSLGAELGSNVIAAEEAGFDGDAMEAEAFAYLAIRACRELPLTYPGTTGVNKPVTGGIIVNPKPSE